MRLFVFTVREKIGAIATPDYIQNAPGLPKTRSGKVLPSRRGRTPKCSLDYKSHQSKKRVGKEKKTYSSQLPPLV